MDAERQFISVIFMIILVVLFAGLLLGTGVGKKMHSGFCPKCNRWYNEKYYYCQDDGEKLLRPAEP